MFHDEALELAPSDGLGIRDEIRAPHRPIDPGCGKDRVDEIVDVNDRLVAALVAKIEIDTAMGALEKLEIIHIARAKNTGRTDDRAGNMAIGFDHTLGLEFCAAIKLDGTRGGFFSDRSPNRTRPPRRQRGDVDEALRLMFGLLERAEQLSGGHHVAVREVAIGATFGGASDVKDIIRLLF